jgi:hypothetical protein
VLDLEGNFVLFYGRNFTAEQIAENRIVTSGHPSMICARDSYPRWGIYTGNMASLALSVQALAA